nr:translation initiation factor IF-2-like [Macaca fascicularis]
MPGQALPWRRERPAPPRPQPGLCAPKLPGPPPGVGVAGPYRGLWDAAAEKAPARPRWRAPLQPALRPLRGLDNDQESQEGKLLAGKTGAPGSCGRDGLGPGWCFASPLPHHGGPWSDQAPNVTLASCHPLSPPHSAPMSSSRVPCLQGAGEGGRPRKERRGGGLRRCLWGARLACPGPPPVTSSPKGPCVPGRYRAPQVAGAASCPASGPAHRPRRRCPGGDTAESPRTPSRHARPSPPLRALTPTRRPRRARVTHGEVSSPPPTSDALTKLPSAPGAARMFPTSPPYAPQTLRASAHAEPLPHSPLAPCPNPTSAGRTFPRRPSAAAQGAPTLQLPRRPSGDLAHPPHHTKQGPRGPHISTQRALSVPEPASAPHPAQDPDASRRPRPGAASTEPPAPRRSLLTSVPALTRGPWVWRCDFAARRPGWPWGSGRGGPAGPRPGRKEGGPRRPLLAPALGPRAGRPARLASRLRRTRSPTSLSEPSRGRGRRPGARGAGGAGTGPWPRTRPGLPGVRGCRGEMRSPPHRKSGRAGGRAGGRRAGGEGEREREEKSSRAAWLRSLAAPGARWAVRAPTAPPGGPRAPLRAPRPPSRRPAGGALCGGIPVRPGRTLAPCVLELPASGQAPTLTPLALTCAHFFTV